MYERKTHFETRRQENTQLCCIHSDPGSVLQAVVDYFPFPAQHRVIYSSLNAHCLTVLVARDRETQLPETSERKTVHCGFCPEGAQTFALDHAGGVS